MPVSTHSFTTGPSVLQDVGELSYNRCTFSPLFFTTLSGTVVKDAAGRTVRYTEFVLVADGYVTLDARTQATNINPTMQLLWQLLTAQGGALTYVGRGFDLRVNPPGNSGPRRDRDVAWGPVPELLEFQPLGGGLSAKVVWRVTVRVVPPETVFGRSFNTQGRTVTDTNIHLLQFNCETSLRYGEDYYSTLTIRGTMEVPMTRPTQDARSVARTVDDFREEIQRRVLDSIDLSVFRITEREFPVSRDKRTMEFSVVAEQKPYMDLPPFCPVARGTFSFKPARAGMGLCLWLCTLRASYTVVPGQTRRMAWYPFLALVRLKMNASTRGNIAGIDNAEGQNPSTAPAPRAAEVVASVAVPVGIPLWRQLLRNQPGAAVQAAVAPGTASGRRAFLIDFTGEEGLYLDSKTVAFSATWRLVTTFSHILVASGLWRKVPERTPTGVNIWAAGLGDVSGYLGPLPNRLDPAQDVIVDFGGG